MSESIDEIPESDYYHSDFRAIRGRTSAEAYYNVSWRGPCRSDRHPTSSIMYSRKGTMLRHL